MGAPTSIPRIEPEAGPLGIVGLGNMGGPMAARLVEAGYELLGFDVSPESARLAADAGVRIVSTVEELASRCAVIVLLLPGSDVVDAVAGQIAAVPADARRCELLVDMSSSAPLRTQALAGRLEASGIALIDAPVSGGVRGAVNGTLTVMMGGPAELCAAATPVFEVVGSRAVHVGAVGAGHVAKALNNFLSASHLLASYEAVIAASRFGLDPALLLSVVNTSSGRSGSTESKLPDFVLTGGFDSGFSAALMEKDVRIATTLAEELGVEAPIAHAVLDRWHELAAALPAGADHTEVIKPLEESNGVRIRRESAVSA